MSLMAPPKYQNLLPYLLRYIEKKLDRSINLNYTPFLSRTEELIEALDENICALVILERLLLENFQNNFYHSDLLKILLEVESLPGYIFSFEPHFLSENYTFFKITDELFFYPIFFENTGALFIDLWKKNLNFCSTYMVLSAEEPFSDLKKKLEITKALGFTRLGTKALDDLADILDLYKSHESEEILTYLRTKSAILVISEGQSSFLEKLGPIYMKQGKNFAFAVFESSLKDQLFETLPKLSCYTGSVDSETLREPLFADLNPFLLSYACLEHAKRAKEKHHHLDPFTLHVLADLFYEWDDYGSALKLYLRAKDYTLQPLELTLSLASIYYIFGDLHEAERLLRSKLCGCLKEDPRVHYNLGIIYLALRKKDYAEYHLYKAFLLNKEEPLFRKQLIKHLWDEGKLEEIQEILKDITDLTPEERIYLGKIAFLRGDYETALNYLRDILSYRDRDGMSLYFLAWLYMYFRMDNESIKILLEEARNKLSKEEFEKLTQELGLPQ